MSKKGKFWLTFDVVIGILFLVYAIFHAVNENYYVALLEFIIFMGNFEHVIEYVTWRKFGHYKPRYQ